MALSLAAIAGADQTDVHFTVRDAVGNPGAVVEVGIDLDILGVNPAAAVIFVDYDPSVLSPIKNYYPAGSTSRDAVRLSEAAAARGKMIATGYPEGQVRFTVFGINTEPLPEGRLVTIAFRIAGNAPLDGLTVLGIVPAGLEGSSVTDAGASELAFSVENGFVSVGCDAPPAPANLQASSGLPDRIQLTWDPVPGAGVQYRVYRATASNPNDAVPLHPDWIDTPQYLDNTAQRPEVLRGAGCDTADVMISYTYYYWVKARGAEGCESGFSAMASGSRGLSKHAAAGAAGGIPAALLFGAAGLLMARGARRKAA